MKDLRSPKIRRKKFLRFFILPLLFFSLTGYSQNLVKGTITDQNGQPLQGVSVIVKGQTVGTSTSKSGSFSINASPNSTLVVSSVGFATKEISVDGQSKIDIQLEET